MAAWAVAAGEAAGGKWFGSSFFFLLASQAALADERGVSFWLPGTFGSFAAVPATPGWSLPLTYTHSDESDLLLVAPMYVSPKPVAGAQAAFSLGARLGRVEAGGESRSGMGDLYPTLVLRTNDGVHNYLTYTMAGVPSGVYPVGTNHWSLDGGGGYTYFNERTGREASAVLGFTYNFRNPDTDYRNGFSMHLDWAATQFVGPQWHVGVVGYLYYQLAGDGGNGATLGDNKSKVWALGPQTGWNLDKSRITLKGYYEFGARNRPEGWNAWLTYAMPL